MRQLTTEIEFTIYRSHELRFRSVQALEIIFRGGVAPTTTQIVQRVVRHFIPLYQVMLDASQQRKTRVGAGFESHIRKMLQTGSIPHEEQAVVSTRRPDFVLPNRNLYVKKLPFDEKRDGWRLVCGVNRPVGPAATESVKNRCFMVPAH